MGDFGVTLAVPVVIFALMGQWLDTKYSTGPWFLVVGFAVAALSSAKIIYTKAKKYGAQYQRLNTANKE